MPGANYMGGERNAMKARAKDAVGRIQKGFFGRQKLDMLYQGLSSKTKPTSAKAHTGLSLSGPSVTSSADASTRAEIAFAHARKKLPVEEEGNRRIRSFIPSPIHVAPTSPRSRKRLKAHSDAHTSSSPGNDQARKKSKVLYALDTLESNSLRRALDEILAMPDLACLSAGKESGKIETSAKRKRSDEDFNPRTKMPMLELPTKHSGKANSSRSRSHTTPSAGSVNSMYCEDNMNWRGRYTQDSNFTPFPEDGHTSLPSSSVRNSEFSEDHYSDRREYSSPWSFHHLQPSSRTSQHTAPSDPGMDLDSREKPRSDRMSMKYSSSLHKPLMQRDIHTDEGRGREVRDLPTVIHFRPRRKGGPLEEEPCVYGKLFEQRDPWQTVGFILGLEEALDGSEAVDELATNGEAGGKLEKEEEKQLPIDDTWAGDDELDGGSPLYTPSFEDIWAAEEGMSDTEDALQDPQHLVRRSAAIFRKILGDEEEDDLLLERSAPFDNDRFSDLGRERKNLSPLQQHNIADEPAGQLERFCSGPRESEQDGDNCDGNVGGAAPFDNGHLSGMEREDKLLSSLKGKGMADDRTPLPEDIDETEIDGPEPILEMVEAVMEEQSSEAENSCEESPDIFALPELREVNGQYLGPSLFDDFDDSEDEA